MQHRFDSRHVDQEIKLFNAIRYLALNPVEAGLCKRPGDWSWSSYNAVAGILPAPPFINVSEIHRLFAEDRLRAENAYVDFIAGSSPEIESLVRSTAFEDRSLGTNKNRSSDRPALQSLFEECDSREARNKAIAAAHNDYGYTLRELSDMLGLHETTICKVATRARNNLMNRI